MTTTLDTLVATAMGWPAGYNFGNDGQSFSPSTNIAHAHMFRDKVLEKHRDWFVMTGHKHGDDYIVHVLADGNAHEIGVSEHELEPTALCLALLRALGVPEEKIKEAMP